MNSMCEWYEISRQAHYQQKRREQKRQAKAKVVVEMVQEIRQRHPRMGGRKLYHRLQPKLRQKGIKMGRDRFFTVLREHNLLVKPKKRTYRTTWPGLWRCDNLLADTQVTQPNQAWVCDLTYLATETGFVYLALVTDLFSRCVVGYDLSTSLSLEGASRAVQMAITQAGQPLGQQQFCTCSGSASHYLLRQVSRLWWPYLYLKRSGYCLLL